MIKRGTVIVYNPCVTMMVIIVCHHDSYHCVSPRQLSLCITMIWFGAAPLTLELEVF